MSSPNKKSFKTQQAIIKIIKVLPAQMLLYSSAMLAIATTGGTFEDSPHK